MKLYKLRLIRFILTSNIHHLKHTLLFYSITSILIFFIPILNDSLTAHISILFPQEFYISATIHSGTHMIDISDKVFTPNSITKFNQRYNYEITVDISEAEIIVYKESHVISTPFEISCCSSLLSISESFAEMHSLHHNDLFIIQGKVFKIAQIHPDADSIVPLILPHDTEIHISQGTAAYKIISNHLHESELRLILHEFVDNPNIEFEILTFDIEEALNTLVNILFGLLFAVGILVLVIASFNIKSMTLISITRRQREITLYYLYGLQEKDLFFIFQIESFCIHFISLLISYLFSVIVIFAASVLLSFGFDPSLIKSFIVCTIQIFFVQRITRKILISCIHESIAKI